MDNLNLNESIQYVWSIRGGGGGGGGSRPASTVHPQKYQEFQAPPKNIWNFNNPKNIPILYLDLKKRP